MPDTKGDQFILISYLLHSNRDKSRQISIRRESVPIVTKPTVVTDCICRELGRSGGVASTAEAIGVVCREGSPRGEAAERLRQEVGSYGSARCLRRFF